MQQLNILCLVPPDGSEGSVDPPMADDSDLSNLTHDGLESLYWQKYGNPDWLALPYVLNLVLSLGCYFAAAFVLTLSSR